MKKTILIGALAPLEGLADDAIRYGDCGVVMGSILQAVCGRL